jgi:predicted RND superfamily exporter protein
MRRVSALILSWPWLVLLVLLVVTSFLGFHARRVQLDFSVENLLASDDPNKAYYDEIRTLFGSDDLAVIGLLTDNVYTPAALEKIRRITAQVEKIDGVSSVNSLTNAPDPIANVDDPPLLIPQIPTNPETLAAIRSKVEDNSIYLNLVSRDAKGAAILIFFKPLTDEQFANKQIEERLQEIIARERGNDELYLAGTQNLKLNSVKLMREDLRTFTPLSVLAIMGVLGVCFRTFRGVFLPLLSVLCGVIWTLGVMALSGAPITIGTLVLPSLLVVIGSTYSIYVIAQYEEEAEKGGSPTDVVERALARVSLPVIVAAFTTIVGFVTLLVNRISTIRALGLYAAVGFTCITIIVLTLIPAVLVRLPLPRRKTRHGERRLTALLRRVGQFSRDYQKAIITGAGLLVLPCLWGITHIRADSNLLQFFHKDAPVRRANEIISEKIGGTQPFNIVVSSGMKEGAKSWDLLRRIKGLQRYLATLPGIDHTLSLVDYCELFDKAIQSGVPMEGVESAEISAPPAEPQAGTGALLASLWENQAQIEPPAQLRPVMQLITLLPKTYSSLVVSPDFSTANILVRTSLTSSSDIIRTAEAVRAYAKEHRVGASRKFGTRTPCDLYRALADVSVRQSRRAVVASQPPGHSDFLWRDGVDGGVPQSGHQYYRIHCHWHRGGRCHSLPSPAQCRNSGDPRPGTRNFPDDYHGRKTDYLRLGRVRVRLSHLALFQLCPHPKIWPVDHNHDCRRVRQRPGAAPRPAGDHAHHYPVGSPVSQTRQRSAQDYRFVFRLTSIPGKNCDLNGRAQNLSSRTSDHPQRGCGG